MRRSSIVNFSDIAIGTKISMRDAGSDIWKLLSQRTAQKKYYLQLLCKIFSGLAQFHRRGVGATTKAEKKLN